MGTGTGRGWLAGNSVGKLIDAQVWALPPKLAPREPVLLTKRNRLVNEVESISELKRTLLKHMNE